MSRIVFVNGRYVPYAQAAVHVEDRGFQFADSVYEVMEVLGGKLVDEKRHIDRLLRSLDELHMRPPMVRKSLHNVMCETVRRNRIHDGLVYLQITRGAARRDFVYPPQTVAPSIVCIARPANRKAVAAAAEKGIDVITMPDIRWQRPDIKTTGLLPNALARQAAKEAGAREAWFVDDEGFITEGAASNAWIVDQDGVLITRPAERGILRGVTRSVIMDLAAAKGVRVVERPFSVEEALKAKEAFVTAATAIVTPVVRIDGHVIGSGSPGFFALDLRKHFHLHAELSS